MCEYEPARLVISFEIFLESAKRCQAVHLYAHFRACLVNVQVSIAIRMGYASLHIVNDLSYLVPLITHSQHVYAA